YEDGEACIDELSIGQETPGTKLRNQVFYVVLDQYIGQLKQRKLAYAFLDETFGFLVALESPSREVINKKCSELSQLYSIDLEPCLEVEMAHFAEIINVERSKVVVVDPTAMLKFILSHHLEFTLPNVVVLLKIYSCILVSNACGERSFSALKRVK